jgi:sulfur-oxidizing protein SoxZ
MSELTKPRVKLVGPKANEPIKAGDVVEVKTLITHIMETGQRKDAKTGQPIPRMIINTFAAKYNGKEVFRMKLQPGISANPYVSFFVKVTAAGDLELTWTEDGGKSITEKVKVELA